MNSCRQCLLAALCSVLLVTASFGPALADPPGGGQGGPPTATPSEGPNGPNGGPPTDHPPESETATPTSAPTGPDTGPDSGPGRGPPDDDSDDGPGEGRGPATGGPPETPPGRATNASDDRETTVNTTISLDERGSALAHRLAAIELLRNTSLGPGHGTGRAQRYATLLNDTRQYVLDPNRTTSAALFRGDKRVVAPVHRRAPDVATHVLISESILVETAIKDAERVRVELRARNLSFNESAVAGQLNHAERAYQQGERLRDRDEISPGAVEHYRRAWTHAQRALDIMDEAVSPVVSIRTRADLPADQETNHSLNGTVFDVRAYELDSAVEFNGSPRAMELRATTVPGTVARFNESVTLPPQPLNSSRVFMPRISVTDPGVDVADRAYDEDEQRDLHRRQTNADVLALDGDGLPDSDERTVTHTDPRVADSDSARTETDEGGDGVVDGATDFDNDSLSSFREFSIGLDPLVADTDGDGLGDGFESRWPTMDPLDADSDDDGRGDSLEDPDNDTLRNGAEFRNGTTPVSVDTDGDGLNDSTELGRHETNPTRTDTDSDGLTDPQELELGTNPLVPDSDDDGIPDGNETFERTTSDSGTGVRLDVRGEGFVAAGLTIENRTPTESVDAMASPVVKVTNRTDFANATITLPLDESTVDEPQSTALDTSGDAESNVTIFTWDPRTGTGWQPVETTVDVQNETATATVSSFSYFVAANEETWIELTTTTFEPQWPAFEPFADLAGWETEGDVTIGANHTVVLTAKQEGDDGGGGGGEDPPEECSLDDPDADCDGDGLTNSEEAELGTGPLVADTDGDELEDGAELQHGANPLVADTDGDGLDDGAEVHVHETKPDVADTDGGGADDGAEIIVGTDPLDPTDDLINQQTVDETTDLAQAVRSISISTDPGQVEIQIRAKADVSGSESAAKIVAGTAEETVTVFEETSGSSGWETETVDLTAFAGQEVGIQLVATGNATLTVDTVRVVRDQDGDGIRDAYEEAAEGFTIPFYRLDESGSEVLYDEPLQLNKSNPDVDGDGVVDGKEIQIGQRFAGGRFGVDEPAFVLGVVSRNSHPNLKNTDGGGLPDERENASDTNAFLVEQLQLGLTVPTVTDEDGVPKPIFELGLERGVRSHSNDRVMQDTDGWAPDLNPLRSPPWEMAEMDEQHQYNLVPATVFLRSNLGRNHIGEIAYHIELEDTPEDVSLIGFYKDGTVFDDSATFLFDGRGGQELSLILEVPQTAVAAENFYIHAGNLTLETKISRDSRFYLGDGSGREDVSHHVSYATHSGLLESAGDLLRTTREIYDKGIKYASLIEGATITYGRTGSLRRVVRTVFWRYAKGSLPVPTGRRGIVVRATNRGMVAFELETERVENELSSNLGYINPEGPVIYRVI